MTRTRIASGGTGAARAPRARQPEEPGTAGAIAPARSPGRPRSQAAHDAILDGAIALLREVGYDALSMEGVAERAGVGKTTIYRRWATKEALVAEAVGRLVSAIRIPDTGTTAGDLTALMRDAVTLYRRPENAELLPGLVAAMARSPLIARAVRSGFLAARRAAIRQVLERGIARGDLRPDLDVEFALDVLGGPLFYRLLVTGGPIDGRLARNVVDLMLRGLAPAH